MTDYISPLDAFRAEVDAAEAEVSASEETKETRAAYTRLLSATNALNSALGKEEEPEEVLSALAVLSIRVGLEVPDAPTFSTEAGKECIGGIGYLLKMPGGVAETMGVDREEFASLLTRWNTAIDALPKAPGKGSATRKEGATRTHHAFKMFYKDAEGNVKRTRPASSIPFETQVNEARCAFGFRKDADAVTKAVSSLLTGETIEVEVPEVGKFWTEVLAG